jgi:hypothetical protein
MNMKIPFTGGCYCGAIRYEVRKKPLMMFNCHCRACQKVSGAAYVPVVVVVSKAFKITQGTLKYHYTDTIGGEKHKRGFCGECGTRITGAEGDTPRPFLAITASSMDDPSQFEPTSDVFSEHAQPWDQMDPKSPKHPNYPPR